MLAIELRGTTGAFTNAAVAAIVRPSRSITWLRVVPSPTSAATSAAVTTVTCGVHERTRVGEVVGAGCGIDDDDRLVAVLPSVAERTVEHRLAPPVGETVDRWEFVVHAGGEHHGVAVNGGAVRKSSTRSVSVLVRAGHRRADDRNAVRVQLGEGIGAEAIGCGRVAGGEAMELVDGRVAVCLVVDDGDPCRALASTSAAVRPAAPPPTTITSPAMSPEVLFMTPTPQPVRWPRPLRRAGGGRHGRGVMTAVSDCCTVMRCALWLPGGAVA